MGDSVLYEVRVSPDEDPSQAIVFRRGGRGRPTRGGDHPLRLKAHNEGVAIRNERFGGRAMVQTRRIA